MSDETFPQAVDGNADREERTTSRRGLFTIGAAAIAGAAVVDVLSSQPADAATGGSVLIGQSNAVTTATDTTSLTGAFQVTDHGVGNGRVALSASQLFSGTNPHFGVVGVSATPYSTLPPAQGAGVKGIGTAGAPGLVGQSSALGSQLLLVPNGSATPSSGNFGAGHFMVASGGDLYYHDAVQWNPVRSVVMLSSPVRIINSTDGTGGISGPLAPGSLAHTSSVLTGANGIPSNAIALIGNFAISGVGGALLNGYGVATIFPAGAATPSTANINAGAGCFAISNTVTVALGTGGSAGKVSIVWNGGGPVPNAHAFFDVAGFIV